MTCAAEQAINASTYASKHVWDLVSPAPEYNATDLRILGGFLKWGADRLRPIYYNCLDDEGCAFLEAFHPAEVAFQRLRVLHDAEGASPNYRAAWKGFFDTVIRKILRLHKAQNLLQADFLAVYHRLAALHSVQGLEITTCAIIWKGFFQGFMNLDDWQKLVVFYQAYFPLKRHMDRLYPVAHSLARDVHFPVRREEGERRSAAVWQDKMRRKWS